jgi:uncharacterized membrane protein YtjA (UPF0391 family)
VPSFLTQVRRIGAGKSPCTAARAPWNCGGVLALSVGNRTAGAKKMLHFVITLLIIALIAAVLGFGGIAGAAVGIAKIVFFVALVLFIISLIAGGFRGFGRRL